MLNSTVFVVYNDNHNKLGLWFKDQEDASRVFVDVGDSVFEYDGISDYLEDGWSFTDVFGSTSADGAE